MSNKAVISRFILLGIICITLNLRTPITSVGPIINLIKEQYGLSNSVAGILTTLPLLAFAFFSPLVAKFRYTTAIFWGLTLIILGEFVRSYVGEIGLFFGTLVIGIGIAIVNVLLPSIIKEKFPKNFRKVMSIYSFTLSLSAAIGVGISVPLAVSFHLGWKNALFVWVVVAIISLILWLPHLGGRRRYKMPKIVDNNSIAIYRYSSAWWITFFMGMQSLIFYDIVAWLPSILIDKGYSLHFASNFSLFNQICSLPTALLTPMFIGKIRNRYKHFLMIALCLSYIAGFGILYISDTFFSIFFAIILLSLPMGGTFGIALLFISTKASSPQKVACLSGMAQSLGYLIAALGPIFLGFMFDCFQSWKPPLMLFILCALGLIFVGYKANNSKSI